MPLKGIEEEIDDFEDEDQSTDEDEDDDENEDLTFITNEIIKLLQFRKKDKDKPFKKSKSSRKWETPYLVPWVQRFCSYENRVPKLPYSEDSFDDEVPKKLTLQEAYDKLCTEFIKSYKTSYLCRKEINEVKTKKVYLLVKLDETTRLVETFVMENTSLEEKVKNLVVELSQAKTQIERMSSAKLNKVFCAQKSSFDKTSLGYVVSSNPSFTTAFRSKTVYMPQSEKGDKGMKSKTDLANSKSFVRPHVCHHCGVSRHIRPNCFKLYPQK